MSNIFEKERINKNSTVRLFPCKVEDITNYKIGMPLLGDETTLVTNLTISDLLQRFSAKKQYRANEYLEKQVILIYFCGQEEYCTNNIIWEYVHMIDFVPTFAFNYTVSDIYDTEFKATDFCFGYVLDNPVSDKNLMNGIMDYLENIFSEFRSEWQADVVILSTKIFGNFDNITETYISNNIYVPVEGGAFNGKE